MQNEDGLNPIRRDSERFPVEASAIIVLDNKIKKGLMIQDVSTRGIRGTTTFSLAKDQALKIILQAPFFDHPVDLEARVAWCKEISGGLWQVGLDLGVDNPIDLAKEMEKMKNKNSGWKEQ